MQWEFVNQSSCNNKKEDLLNDGKKKISILTDGFKMLNLRPKNKIRTNDRYEPVHDEY